MLLCEPGVPLVGSVSTSWFTAGFLPRVSEHPDLARHRIELDTGHLVSSRSPRRARPYVTLPEGGGPRDMNDSPSGRFMPLGLARCRVQLFQVHDDGLQDHVQVQHRGHDRPGTGGEDIIVRRLPAGGYDRGVDFA